jgi:hypothetical protein
MLILFLISLIIFISYVSFIWIKYGVLSSISESYYILPEKLQILFTLFCFGCGFPIVIVGVPLTPLMFFAGASMCFIGAASSFKRSFTHDVHYISAILAIIFAQLSILSFSLWPLCLIFIIGSILIKLILKKNTFWWVEILAFITIYIALVIKLF